LVYILNEVLLTHKEEWKHVICGKIDGTRDHDVRCILTKTNVACFLSYIESRGKNEGGESERRSTRDVQGKGKKREGDKAE
jgi:hypothetical protein